MTKKKILIIEDDIEVLDALKSLLESVGYNVSTAKDGFQGLMKARNAKPDLVLLDVMIPKINGFKVCRLLKFDDTYKNIPVVILTARTEDEDKILGEKTGCDLYLKKHVATDQLIDSINSLINPGVL